MRAEKTSSVAFFSTYVGCGDLFLEHGSVQVAFWSVIWWQTLWIRMAYWYALSGYLKIDLENPNVMMDQLYISHFFVPF